MPKMPPRNKQRVRFSGSPRSAASLLQDIRRGAVHASGGNGGPGDAGVLLTALRAGLGDLGAHVLQARVRDGALVIYTGSAAWAARLRLAVSEHMAARPALPLPGVGPDARVVVRIMPRDGYRR